jgi:hypothetical protein
LCDVRTWEANGCEDDDEDSTRPSEMAVKWDGLLDWNVPSIAEQEGDGCLNSLLAASKETTLLLFESIRQVERERREERESCCHVFAQFLQRDALVVVGSVIRC